MTKYYITDETTDETEQLTKEKFYESLEYNINIAKQYGDKLPSTTKIIKKFNTFDEYQINANGFTYTKMKGTTCQHKNS